MATRVARGAATTLLAQWAKFALQVSSVIVLARLLEPSDFGVYSMVAAITGVATLLSDFGLSMAAMRSHGISDQHRTNLYWLNTALGLVAGVLVFAFAPGIAALYGEPAAGEIARVLAVLFVLQASAAQLRAEAARQFRFGSLAVVDIASQAIALAVGIAGALLGYGFWALVWQQFGLAIATLALLLILAPWRPGLPRRAAGMLELVRFGANTGGVQFVNYITSNVDTILLGRFAGPAVVGVYNQAFQLFKTPLQQLAAPMTRVAVPALSKLEDDETFTAYALRAQTLLTYVLGTALTVAGGVAVPLFAVLLGPKWSGVAPIFVVLAIGGIFQAFGYVYYWIFLARALTGIQLRVSLVSRSLMVLAMVVGVHWGALGVAAGASFGLFLNWALLTWKALPQARVPVGRVLEGALRPMAVFAVAFTTIWLVVHWCTPRMRDLACLAVGLVTAALVLGGLFAALPFCRRDVGALLDTVGRLRGGKAKGKDKGPDDAPPASPVSAAAEADAVDGGEPGSHVGVV